MATSFKLSEDRWEGQGKKKIQANHKTHMVQMYMHKIYDRQTNEALQKGSTTQEAWRLLQARPNQLQHGSLSVSQPCKPWVVCTCLGTGHDSGTITPKRGLHKVYDNTVTQRSLHKVHSIRATLGLVYTCLGTSLAGHTLLA